jgi:hypothetical protein
MAMKEIAWLPICALAASAGLAGCETRSESVDPNFGVFCDAFRGHGGGAYTTSGAGTSPSGCGSSTGDMSATDADLSTEVVWTAPVGCYRSGSVGFSNASTGADYPAGSAAGAFITRSAGIDDSMIEVTATLDGSVVATATGPTLAFEAMADVASAEEYVSFQVGQPFNGVEITISLAGSSAAEARIFELCGNGGRR